MTPGVPSPGPGQEERGGSRRRVLGMAAAVITVQIVLMVLAFNPTPHTGGDNAGYLNLAHSLLERGAYLDLHDPAEPAHTKYPPVFPAILAGAMLLGARSWITFKALSGLFTTLGIAFAFAWVNHRRGPVFAAAVALILATSDAFLWSSQWILSDPPFVAFTFLSLWALERGGLTTSGSPDPGGSEHRGRWIVLGAGAAILAYFTRSAGLPLILAVAGALALSRRWKALGVFGAAFAVPAGLWWFRGRGILGSGYVSEALLVDPYQPSLGRANLADFVGRIGVNLDAYIGVHIPGGLSGHSGSVLLVLGVVLTTLAIGGWIRRVLNGPGVAEIFVPLYTGVLLLWPVVWSGDRFALPLYPFLLFYAGEAILDVVGRWNRRVARAVAVAGVLVLVVPAGIVWVDNRRNARLCREIVAEASPFACYQDRVLQFVAAARWSGENLPAEAVLFTRKPRLFYTLSGLKSRMYPLSRDPDVFFERARSQGIDWLIIDYLDELGRMYLTPVVQARAGGFCVQTSWGPEGTIRTELLGIVPPEDEEELTVEREEDAVVMDLRVCPRSMLARNARRLPDFRSPLVPLLAMEGS